MSASSSTLAEFVGGSFHRAIVMTLDKVVIDVLVLAIAYILPKQPQDTVQFLMYALFLSMMLLVVRDLIAAWKDGSLVEKLYGARPRPRTLDASAESPRGGNVNSSQIVQRLEAAAQRAFGNRDVAFATAQQAAAMSGGDDGMSVE
jgi:hypothetical protein